MTHSDLSLRPRTRRVFTDDDMARMSALYYDPATPLTKVAGAFGVPVSTFLRWIAEMDWPRRSARGPTFAPQITSPPAREEAPAPARQIPGLADALRDVERLARRELTGLEAERPRNLAERERVARLVASLTRSLDRIVAAREAETRRKTLRDFNRQWTREKAARDAASR